MPEHSIVENNSWTAKDYANNVRFVSELGAGAFQDLAPQSGEHILDLGCGDGFLTCQLVEAGAKVVAIDASQSMVDAAVEQGLDARRMDGCALTFDAEFDAVFSNAALHWMQPPEDVITGVYRALKTDGRFVAEFGAIGNVAAVRTALYALLDQMNIDAARYDPWFFPSVAQYSALLSANGFRVERMALIPRPTPLPGSIIPWLETFCGPFLEEIAPEGHGEFFGRLEHLLAASLRDSDGNWFVDYTRLRFKAIRVG